MFTHAIEVSIIFTRYSNRPLLLGSGSLPLNSVFPSEMGNNFKTTDNFAEIYTTCVHKLTSLKLSLGSCWEVNIQNTSAVITCVYSEYLTPKFEIFVDQSLSFTVIRTFGWMLSEDHELYAMYDRSFLNVTLFV